TRLSRCPSHVKNWSSSVGLPPFNHLTSQYKQARHLRRHSRMGEHSESFSTRNGCVSRSTQSCWKRFSSANDRSRSRNQFQARLNEKWCILSETRSVLRRIKGTKKFDIAFRLSRHESSHHN